MPVTNRKTYWLGTTYEGQPYEPSSVGLLAPSKSVQYRQPNTPTDVTPKDWASIIVPSIGAGLIDIVRPGAQLTASASSNLQAGTNGLEYKNGDGNAGISYGNIGFHTLVPITSPVSYYTLVRVDSLGSRQVVFADWNTAGASESIACQITATNFWQVGVSNWTTSSIPVTLGWHSVVLAIASNYFILYVDGQQAATNLVTRRAGSNAKWLGSGNYVGNIGWTGAGALFAVGKHFATYAMAGEFAKNPWGAIFEPSNRNIWVPT